MSPSALTAILLLATSNPSETVRRFHEALQSGNAEAALSYLEPSATVMDSGNLFGSRDLYATQRLAAHMKLARASAWERTYERVLHTGKSGWVISRYELTGAVNAELDETANVVDVGGGWKIAHLHWSFKASSPRVEPPPPPPPPSPPGMGRHCIRETTSCWRCADITFPAEVSCPASFPCPGVCVIQGGAPRCFEGQLRCCDEGTSCEKPPGCDAASSCGDKEGDGRMDQCTFLSKCEDKPQRKRGPCAPPPSLDRYRQYGESSPNAPCRPAALEFHISAEKMASGASDDSGPGICYGVVSFDASGRQAPARCGAYHCETLRYCDGRERERYCTVLAECRDGVPTATGFTW